MLKLGDKTIGKLYVGDKPIYKAYWGDKLVYQAGKPILLDYIESNGVAYINTELKPSYNYTVKIKYQYTNLNNLYNPILGMRTDAVGSGSGLFWAGMSNNTKEAYLRFGANAVNYPMGDKALDVIEMTCSPEGIFINGEDTGARYFDGEITSEAKPVYLFTLNGQHGANYDLGKTNAKVYSYQVFDGDMNLIQDLRPCIDPKGIVCMYDMVTKKYFYNQGTGQFKAGGRFVKSIVFDGNSWIDTGINKQSCTIECIVKLENAGYRQFLCGWSHLGCYYIAVDTSNRFDLGSSVILTGSNATELSNVVAEHTQTKMALTVNGNYVKRTILEQTEPDKNYWLGNVNSTSYSAPIKGEVYGHKFKNADGVLIQDLRPYVDENGTACFKDVVTGNLFYNQGTGTLTYTE